LIEEHAIAVVFLAQGSPTVSPACVERLDLIERFAALGGDGGQVIVLDPDEARFARAAMAAARAGERQTVFVPGFGNRGVQLSSSASTSTLSGTGTEVSPTISKILCGNLASS